MTLELCKRVSKMVIRKDAKRIARGLGCDESWVRRQMTLEGRILFHFISFLFAVDEISRRRGSLLLRVVVCVLNARRAESVRGPRLTLEEARARLLKEKGEGLAAIGKHDLPAEEVIRELVEDVIATEQFVAAFAREHGLDVRLPAAA